MIGIVTEREREEGMEGGEEGNRGRERLTD